MTFTLSQIHQFIMLPADIQEMLLPFQLDHVKNLIYSIMRYNCVLDASDTGTGKTYTILAAAKALHLSPFIICPKPVMPGWHRALDIMRIKALAVTNYETIKNGKIYNRRLAKVGEKRYITEKIKCPWMDAVPNTNIGQYESKFLYRYSFPPKTLVVVDEAHRTKNPNTQNAQLLLSLIPTNVKIALLSATIAEDPLKLIPAGIALQLFKSKPDFYLEWAPRHGCYKEELPNGLAPWKFSGNPKNIKQIHDEIFPEKGCRMKISEIPDFPETSIFAETYSMGEDEVRIQKVYKDNKGLAMRTEARMEIEKLKVNTLAELAEDALEEGNSVVVFANFTKTIQHLMDKLNTRCTIWGLNTAEQNERNRLTFQQDRSRVILCNIQAAREGIDLDDVNGKFPRVAFLCPTDSAQNMKQCFGRVHRAKSKSKSIQYVVYCANTVEEEVCDIVRYKVRNLALLNDGDIGKGVLF